MSSTPPLLILGSGALGCLFAARLSAAGTPVMISGTWAEGLRALRQNGVRLIEADGRVVQYPVQVADCPGQACYAQFALVLVKAWQTLRLGGQLAGVLAPDGLALTLQNGAGNREALVQILGERRVALGVTTYGANLIEPGIVRAAGEGLISLEQHPRLAPLAGWLSAAGFQLETVTDASAVLWGKLVINAAINPLTALLGVPNGALLEHGPAREIMHAAAHEAAAVAAAIGMRLPYPEPVAAAENVARKTAANRSSMLQDIQRGAPTEIDAICGAIVRAGERAGVPTPVNRTLWLLVKAKVEAGARQLPGG